MEKNYDVIIVGAGSEIVFSDCELTRKPDAHIKAMLENVAGISRKLMQASIKGVLIARKILIT